MTIPRRAVLGMTAGLVLGGVAACTSGGSSTPQTSSSGGAGGGAGDKIVVASVNNDPMVTLSELAPEFTKKTGIKVEFVMLTENDIRSKIQQDVAVKGGQFDVVTLGTNDVGTYLDSDWTIPLQEKLDGMSAEDKAAYDVADLIKAVVPAFSSQKKGLAALPFYGESTMIMYRKDLFQAKNLTMPATPTWEQIYDFAVKLDGGSTVGMAIRGKAGYGENMYVFNTIMNAYGGQVVDMNWQPQYQTPQMSAAWEFYKKLQQDAGAKEASSNGYTETLNLMASGKAGIYYDATVSAATFEGKGSAVKGKMGYALSPSGPGKGNTQTVGGWGVAIPSSSTKQDAAFKFITWATSKDYVKLVADKNGWASVPSGARTSTYNNAEYKKVAPYAALVLKSLETVEFEHPAVGETPYTGNSLPNIPEWSSMGEQIGQTLANYISTNTTTDAALADAQKIAVQAMKDGGRI